MYPGLDRISYAWDTLSEVLRGLGVVYGGIAFAVVVGVLFLPLTYLLTTSPMRWLAVVGAIAVGFVAIYVSCGTSCGVRIATWFSEDREHGAEREPD